MRPGDIVADKYRVDSVIAKGGMGTVYAATHVTLRQRVAIKELLPGAVIVRGASERFLREAQMAALLTSRHVLRILDFGQIDGLPFIVMELLNGHDLASELRRCKKLSVERATDYVLQACVGVAEAHARGIIHRDLKPGNLFLSHSVDGAVEIKVLDFGISKILSNADAQVDLTKTSNVLGSPRYMSPEQVRSSKHVDQRSDIWALGVILYQLVSGKRPFEGPTESAVLAQIVADPPPPLHTLEPTIPAAFERLVLNCLEKNPERRPGCILALARGLMEFAPDATRYLESIEHISSPPAAGPSAFGDRSGKARPATWQAATPSPAAAAPDKPRSTLSAGTGSTPVIDPGLLSAVGAGRAAIEARGSVAPAQSDAAIAADSDTAVIARSTSASSGESSSGSPAEPSCPEHSALASSASRTTIAYPTGLRFSRAFVAALGLIALGIVSRSLWRANERATTPVLTERSMPTDASEISSMKTLPVTGSTGSLGGPIVTGDTPSTDASAPVEQPESIAETTAMPARAGTSRARAPAAPVKSATPKPAAQPSGSHATAAGGTTSRGTRTQSIVKKDVASSVLDDQGTPIRRVVQ